METPVFVHQFNHELYNKSLSKFEKMVETEKGQKFFTHLVRAFLDVTEDLVVDECDSISGIFKCDITNSKCITRKVCAEFQAIVTSRLESFERIEEESDEDFEIRQKAYYEALITSNPYAVNKNYGYRSDKSDKILCVEALAALNDMRNKILNEPALHPDLVGMIEERPKKIKKPAKKGKKVQKEQKHKNGNTIYRTRGFKETTIGDLVDFTKIKSKVE